MDCVHLVEEKLGLVVVVDTATKKKKGSCGKRSLGSQKTIVDFQNLKMRRTTKMAARIKGTVPLVVCIRVPVSFKPNTSKTCEANYNVKLLTSKLKRLVLTKEDLINQFEGQSSAEMCDHFDEGELNTYLQGI